MEDIEKSKQLVTESEQGDARPWYCPEEDGDGEACKECLHLSYQDVSHPGGSSYHTVKSYNCLLGYWEDNF